MNNSLHVLATFVALFTSPMFFESVAAQAIPGKGDEIVVRVDNAPAKAEQQVFRLRGGSSLTVHDASGEWLLVTIPGGREKAWVHQNHVALKDAPKGLANGPVPIANLLRIPLLDTNDPFLLMHLPQVASGISSGGRNEELLRLEDGLLRTLNRAADNPLAPLIRVSIYAVMGETHLNLGNRAKGLEHINRGFDLLETIDRDIAAGRLDLAAFRPNIFEQMGLFGIMEATKGGDLVSGERKLAAATSGLDKLPPNNNLVSSVDGNSYTQHADVLIRLGRLQDAERLLHKAELVNLAFRKYAIGINQNASGTTGLRESLLALCRAKADDPSGALAQMEKSQRQQHRYTIWRGHAENPNWENVVREDPLALIGELSDYPISLAYHCRDQADAAELSTQWVLNRKLKLEERLRQRMAIIRETPSQGPSRILGMPLLGMPLGEMATMPRILAARGLAADYRLRKFPEADRDDADREFQMIRYVGTALAATRVPVVPGGRNAVETHDTLAANTWVDVPKIQSNLRAGEALIELVRYRQLDIGSLGDAYRWLPSRYAAWIIPASGKVVQVDLGEADRIEKAIEQLREQIQADGEPEGNIRTLGEREALDALTTKSHELADLLIEPLRAHLEAHKDLVISPDGELWLVPWAALPWGENQFLIERFGLRHIMAGRDLIKPEKDPNPQAGDEFASENAKPDPSIIIADPDFELPLDDLLAIERDVLGAEVAPPPIIVARRGSSILPKVDRLRFAKPEAEAIAPLIERYTGAKPRVHLGKEAIEGLFSEMRRPRILVLGTHGFFLPANAKQLGGNTLEINDPTMRCGLLLAGCNRIDDQLIRRGADGVLTGYEVEALDLRGTELVVLSACDTGVGDAKFGEGVAGLRQAFQIAGAKSVLASLWQVPDRDTALIMVKFFENLTSNQEKSDALRNAQLSRIAERRERYGAAHPLFWAALTLTE